MLRTLQTSPSFRSSCQYAGATSPSAWPTARWFRQAATALRTVSEAWHECFAAHHQYRQLTSRGIRHETAIREALGFGPAPAARATRKSSKVLGFAGKA
jgi:hypothetical protein